MQSHSQQDPRCWTPAAVYLRRTVVKIREGNRINAISPMRHFLQCAPFAMCIALCWYTSILVAGLQAFGLKTQEHGDVRNPQPMNSEGQLTSWLSRRILTTFEYQKPSILKCSPALKSKAPKFSKTDPHSCPWQDIARCKPRSRWSHAGDEGRRAVL